MTDLPDVDRRHEVRTTDTAWQLPTYASRAEWEARAASLRQHVLASAGLLPAPRRTSLRAKIFDRREQAGYTVEKVQLQTLPGFYLCGNLFRPAQQSGPAPAILTPHGHWAYGRLVDCESGSIPGRCRQFARQGYVVLSYDMVGYNDTDQLPHAGIDTAAGRPPAPREALHGPGDGALEQLWGISLMGLQLWNSIRALDFLCSLPDVDAARIGCTGASGGGTQTYLLTAVDDRVKAAAPVCMVSAHFQGGCVCENGPNLRLAASNVELAALAAPRPLLLVSASGDWTRNNPVVEYPWLRSIYRLFDAEEKVANRHFEAEHNYNQQSLDAVAAWFGKWLLGLGEEEYRRLADRSFPYESLPDPARLLVFYNRRRSDSLTAERLVAQMVRERSRMVRARPPKTKASLSAFRRRFGPVFRSALSAYVPRPEDLVARQERVSKHGDVTVTSIILGRRDAGDRVVGVLLDPSQRAAGAPAVLIAHGHEMEGVLADGRPHGLAAELAGSGCCVMAIDPFRQRVDAPAQHGPRFFTTYNHTETANRVQDVLTAAVHLRAARDGDRIALVGLGDAGLWCLLAYALAPDLHACVADAGRFPIDDDAAYVRRLFVPLLRRAGGLRAAAVLAAPRRLLIHNTGESFDNAWFEATYRAAGAPENLRLVNGPAPARDMAAFLLADA